MDSADATAGALYTSAPIPPAIPIVPSTNPASPSFRHDPQPLPSDEPVSQYPTEPEALPNSFPLTSIVPADPDPSETGDDETPAPPTTRSKTAPSRRPPTPTPPPTAEETKRGVITLSDVMAARGVLAEKANAHWVKGLGGGQNKEGETIVNFLYKMRVGPGEWSCRGGVGYRH